MLVSNLTFYKLLFVVEIVVAEFLFAFNLKKRKYFILRFAGCILVLLGVAAVFPVVADNAWYSSIIFLVLFALTVPMLWFCYAEPWLNILFCAIAAYTLQHFAYELANLLLSLLVWGRSPILGLYDSGTADFWAFTKESIFYMLIYLMCYFASYAVIYKIFGKRIKKGYEMKIKNLSLFLLIAAALLVDIVLNSVLIYVETDLTSSVVNYATNLLCCILLLYCQFSLLLTKELKDELQIVHRLWYQEREQYLISKENIDLINMKCHDMRHQIREIGKSKSISSETIKEIESSISLYDSMVKTGNEVLDIILTEKSLRCHKRGIVLTCVADGELLNFINTADLYSLFGNALDNAIEAVLKLPDGDNRIIGLRIHAVGNLITINLKNSYKGELVYDEHGYPKTTKEDSNYHGYGIKSILYVVEKYDGNLSIVAKNDSFNLNILIPIPDLIEVKQVTE